MGKMILLSELKLNPNNPQIFGDLRKLELNIKEFSKMLELRPLVVDENNMVLGGNKRLVCLRNIGMEEIPEKWVLRAEDLTESEKKRFIISDNTNFGGWDFKKLEEEFADIDLNSIGDFAVSFDGFEPVNNGEDENTGGGYSSTGQQRGLERENRDGVLAERFIAPPFTILDTRQGYWQKRKTYWHSLIGDNGETREDLLRKSKGIKDANYYNKKTAKEKELGKTLSNAEFEDYYTENTNARINNGTSILDPVLAEIACKWFGVEGGKTFDCFAGDSVFGWVSTDLGNTFTGIDIRQEQVDKNNERINERGNYICDDGRNIRNHLKDNSQDLLFSCPPYYDLEVYSDLEDDASNQESYEDFLAILETAFSESIKILKENRFAFIVVGDIRDKDGSYRLFVDDIKRIFVNNGMKLLNEMILVEQVGSAAIRAAKQMKHRKVAKVHQNVLVFYKGDPRDVKNVFEEIEFDLEKEEDS